MTNFYICHEKPLYTVIRENIIVENYQKILFPYAYNILGSAEDARDAIQDVLVKYLQVKTKPENEKNYLIRAVINQSINLKKKQQKLAYDNNLPQPIVTSDYSIQTELNDLVSYSLLLLLEKLNPKERAVFILKEAFAYTHQEIADVLSITEENSRKILSRASSKVHHQKAVSKTHKPSKNHEKLKQFIEAIQQRNLEQLHSIFKEDISFRADGGKHMNVVAKLASGIDKVSELMVFIYHKFQTGYEISYYEVNHQPSILYFEGKVLRACQVFEIDPKSNKIASISVILDPIKLNRIFQNN